MQEMSKREQHLYMKERDHIQFSSENLNVAFSILISVFKNSNNNNKLILTHN